MTYRAIMADDHEIVRRALADILADIGNVDVIAEAENGIETMALVKQHQPDLLARIRKACHREPVQDVRTGREGRYQKRQMEL